MHESNSTTLTPSGKPNQPYLVFPLFPHAAAVWTMKILGKMHCFGRS
jgi:hypothetical protein